MDGRATVAGVSRGFLVCLRLSRLCVFRLCVPSCRMWCVLCGVGGVMPSQHEHGGYSDGFTSQSISLPSQPQLPPYQPWVQPRSRKPKRLSARVSDVSRGSSSAGWWRRRGASREGVGARRSSARQSQARQGDSPKSERSQRRLLVLRSSAPSWRSARGRLATAALSSTSSSRPPARPLRESD